MKTAYISTFAVALLLSCRPGVGQTIQKRGDDPLVTTHRSTGSRNLGKPNTQAIAREMANSLAGDFEKPAMAPTRSSFLAKWKPVSGATGYRLDVSTSPSFDSYVNGFRDVDVGTAMSHVVTGLKAATDYYYRVRTYDSAATGSNSETMLAA